MGNIDAFAFPYFFSPFLINVNDVELDLEDNACI
jgi:hypothetical protein